MADPHLLYIVMTVVLIGLVTWVVVVWASPAFRWPASGSSGTDPVAVGPRTGEPSPASSSAQRPEKSAGAGADGER